MNVDQTRHQRTATAFDHPSLRPGLDRGANRRDDIALHQHIRWPGQTVRTTIEDTDIPKQGLPFGLYAVFSLRRHPQYNSEENGHHLLPNTPFSHRASPPVRDSAYLHFKKAAIMAPGHCISMTALRQRGVEAAAAVLFCFNGAYHFTPR
ncbi:hypothetical protein [Sphingosinicella soli]|uniref:Uncharacterized protein n=1 Tax=Sphingosinicella soli TaxID=333708 RepID=A0A7W7F7Z1_9SPHN|nr:hypothetical protein [Sphingosinicella soli]MBB4633966.1 hypothetical protein [Sphingosinicella soli]